MKIFNSYYAGLKSAAKLKKMVTVIYAVIVLLALVLALPFQSVLSSLAGNTMELDPLLRHFNYSVYSDFMNSSGKYIKPFISTAIWMGAFYYLFTVFFTGGILNILDGESRKFSITDFLSGCGKYFFRFFRLGIYLLVIQLLIAVAIFLPLGKILSGNYETTQNEASLFYITLAGVIVFAVISILVLIVGDYAKIILFRNDSGKVIRAVGRSVKFVFRHLLGTYILYLIISIILVLLFVIYLWLDDAVGMISGVTIFIMFLIQQIFIWLRVLTKIWLIGSELSFYEIINGRGIQSPAEKSHSDNLSAGNGDDAINNFQIVE
jgi:hypothetical protein